MKTHEEFAPADRYLYDFGLCGSKHGFAQVDTTQDASYYGTWANPTRFLIFCYCEGDTTLQECETAEEFIAAMRELARWNKDSGYWKGIDALWAGHPSGLHEAFEKLGLADLFH